jgi:hypothetical protein
VELKGKFREARHRQGLAARLALGMLCVGVLILTSAKPPSARAADFVPGRTYFGANQYVEYLAGDLPIILSVPHGGDISPDAIPDRTEAITINDPLDQEYSRELVEELRRLTGRTPHVVINRLARRKLDPNRSFTNGAQRNPIAERAWAEFHGFIDVAKSAVQAQCGRGHYFDLHTNGKDANFTEFGYLLAVDELMLADENLIAGGYEHRSSIRTLAGSLDVPFPEILRGPGSLGGIMQRYGYWSVPSPAYPYPVDLPYYNGNYDIERHGSRRGGVINGTQIEAPYGRLLEVDRARFVRSLARAIVAFLEAHYGFSLMAGSPEGICTRFNDVPYSHWAREPIEYLAGKGYLAGCKAVPPEFCPDASLTRAELALLLVKSVRGPDYVPEPAKRHLFGDVLPDAQEEGWILAAWGDGLVRPCGAQPLAFCPGEPATRSDVAFGLLRFKHGKPYAPPEPLGLFEDVALYDRDAAWGEAAFSQGLLKPCGNSPGLSFCPGDPIPRGEAAAVLAGIQPGNEAGR